jgi:hypothetical protein
MPASSVKILSGMINLREEYPEVEDRTLLQRCSQQETAFKFSILTPMETIIGFPNPNPKSHYSKISCRS